MSEEEKAELEELYENSEWWHNRFNAVQRDYEELKVKIDKAIEYIHSHREAVDERNSEILYWLTDDFDEEDILEILGDKENGEE